MTNNSIEEHELLTQIVAKYPSFDKYLILDCATTGFSPAKHHVIDLGYIEVEHGNISAMESFIINWESDQDSDGMDYIQAKLEKQKKSYREQNKPHYYDLDRLKKEGVDPAGAIYSLAVKIHEYIKNGWIIASHSLLNFDGKFITKMAFEYLDEYNIDWEQAAVFDTGLIEKAISNNIVWGEHQSLHQWLQVVTAVRSKAKWNLDTHCREKYALDFTNMPGIEEAQTTLVDCYRVYTLISKYLSIVDEYNEESRDKVTTGEAIPS